MKYESFSDFLIKDVARSAICLVDEDKEITWSELGSRSRALAQGFADLGVVAGDRVGIWLPNRAAWLISFLACAQLGAVAVSINTRFKSGEVGDLLYRSASKLLVYWPGYKSIDFNGILSQCSTQSLGGLEKVVLYQEELGEMPGTVAGKPAVSFASLLSGPECEAVHTDLDSVCIMFTTSGTTKAPKLVMHTQRGVLAHAENVARQYGLTNNDRFLLLPPLCGVYGFCSALSALSARVPMVIFPAWNPQQALELCKRHSISYLIASNEAVAQLFDAAAGDGSFPQMRFIVQANLNPVHASIATRGEALGVSVIGLYGSSEMQALFASFSVDSPVLDRGQSGGRPASLVAKVRTRDPESGQLCGHGVPGELEFFAPENRFSGYYLDPESTKKAFTDDGYFKSGDLGITAADGNFIFLARMGDTLRLGGFLVSPSEIEEHLQEHPSVLGCQIVGVNMGDAIKPIAYCTARGVEGINEETLIAFASARLAKYKVPIRVFVIDEFPMTAGANGLKVQKNKLRELAEQALFSTQ